MNNQTDVQEGMAVDGAFIFIGLSPNCAFLKNSGIRLEPWAFVATGQSLITGGKRQAASKGARPVLAEISIPSIFAAGDVRDASTKRVVSAAGEGGTAAFEIRQYLKKTRVPGTLQDQRIADYEIARRFHWRPGCFLRPQPGRLWKSLVGCRIDQLYK